MPLIDGKHTCRCQSVLSADGFSSSHAPKQYPPDLQLEPVHLDIDLQIDIDSKTAQGTVTSSVVARCGGPRTLELDAVGLEDLHVEDPSGAELTHRYDGEVLVITWGESFDAGEERKLAVTYRVTEPASGLFFSSPSDAYPDAGYWAATDHETERARYWLPCIDLPNVRTKLDFHLRAREDLTILANGRLEGSESHEDGTKTAHWKLDFPCPSYLVCFAIGEFTEETDGEFEGIPVAYYTSRRFGSEELRLSFGRTKKMLGWMTEKLGMEFPFPKYYQFALQDISGAMENISLVSWDDIFILDETLAEEWSWLLDQINVHEMAHSYFGDAVVCRDFAHAWLKESWATYMEQCWLEDEKGEDEKLYDFHRNAHAYFQEADEKYSRPIVTRTFETSWEMYDRHLYPGGACRLHTLRNELGDEVFWEAVRDYLQTYAGEVVETDDFRRIMEKHSGRSLGKFFDQWLFRAGYPDLRVQFSYDSEDEEGTFTVEQKQAKGDDGKVDEDAVFELKLELGWTLEGTSHRENIELSRQKQTFVFAMKDDPKMVRVDPGGKVLHKLDFNPGDEKLRAQLTDAPDVIGRILAAHELAKTGKKANHQALADAWDDEPFWGVRQQIAKALADAGTDHTIGVLADLIGEEEDPMVLESLIRTASQFRDERLADAARRRLDGLELYRARQAAWELLGAQREQAPFSDLVEATGEEDIHGFAAAGAVRALAGTRRKEAIEPLIERSEFGNAPHRVRGAAAAALGELGGFLEDRDRERVRERLEDLLRDDNESVRMAAAGGLIGMYARESVESLEAFKKSLSRQQQVLLKRKIDQVRKGKDEKVKNLEKQLDEMRETLRKLEDRLQKVEGSE